LNLIYYVGKLSTKVRVPVIRPEEKVEIEDTK